MLTLFGFLLPFGLILCQTLQVLTGTSGETRPSSNGNKQTLHYSIKLFNKSIGSIQAVKTEQNGECSYAMTSFTSISVIKRVEVEFNSHSHFRDGRLVTASTQNEVNGEEKAYSRVHWNGQHYQIEVDGEQSVLQQSISNSLNALYFQEPLHIKQIFSERFATFLPLKEIKPHTYELTLPDNRKNYYTYVNGVCTKVEVNLSYGKLIFVLEPSAPSTSK